MPHLNELHDKYTARGFTLVALTPTVTDSFLQKYKIRYPVGVGGNSARAYGIRTIPHAYLIGADGKVVWEGHTSGLSPATIEAELAKIVRFPKRDSWPRKVAGAARDAERGRLGKAWKALERIREPDEEAAEAVKTLRDYIETVARTWLAEAKAAAEAGDYLEAERTLQKVQKSLAGHPAADEAKQRLREFRKDRDIQRAIRAARIVEQGQELERRKNYRGAYAAYLQAAKIGEGTRAGEQAKQRAQAIADKAR